MCAQCSSGLAHQMDPHLSSSTEMPDPGSGRRTPGTAWRSLVSAYRSGRSGHKGAIFPPPTMILNLMDLVRHDDPVPGLTEQPHPAARDRAKPRSAAQGCRLQARVAGHGTPHPGEIIQIELRPAFPHLGSLHAIRLRRTRLRTSVRTRSSGNLVLWVTRGTRIAGPLPQATQARCRSAELTTKPAPGAGPSPARSRVSTAYCPVRFLLNTAADQADSSLP
jgi:hypothetical protein